MRSFIAAVIIGVAVIAGSLFFTARIEDFSASLCENIEEIADCLEKEDYVAAQVLARETADFADSEKPLLTALMDHTELDKIETGLAELQGYIDCGAGHDAIAECRVLDVLIRHIPKNYKIKIENIL